MNKTSRNDTDKSAPQSLSGLIVVRSTRKLISSRREKNKALIHNALRLKESQSQKELRDILGLSLPTIARAISDLLSEGLIVQVDSLRGKRGPPASRFAANPSRHTISNS